MRGRRREHEESTVRRATPRSRGERCSPSTYRTSGAPAGRPTSVAGQSSATWPGELRCDAQPVSRPELQPLCERFAERDLVRGPRSRPRPRMIRAGRPWCRCAGRARWRSLPARARWGPPAHKPAARRSPARPEPPAVAASGGRKSWAPRSRCGWRPRNRPEDVEVRRAPAARTSRPTRPTTTFTATSRRRRVLCPARTRPRSLGDPLATHFGKSTTGVMVHKVASLHGSGGGARPGRWVAVAGPVARDTTSQWDPRRSGRLTAKRATQNRRGSRWVRACAEFGCQRSGVAARARAPWGRATSGWVRWPSPDVGIAFFLSVSAARPGAEVVSVLVRVG